MNDTGHERHLDGWRGISILLLLSGHFALLPTIAGHYLYTGRLGVECFFVLSGRLMAEILFVRATPLDKFYWRRVSRVFPALWLFVLAMLMATAAWPWLGVHPVAALTAVTFTLNYLPAEAGVAGNIWSLCVEEHAYVILTIATILCRHFDVSPIKILGALAAVCMLNGAFQTLMLHRDYYQVYWHSDVRMASVFVSAALYLRFRNTPFHPAIAPAAAMAGCAVSLLGSVPDVVKYSLGTSLLAFSLVILPTTWAFVLSMLGSRVLTYFGIWSFSLYLWQQPFVGREPRIGLLAAAAVLALGSFYAVERPARAFLNRQYAAVLGRVRWLHSRQEQLELAPPNT
jgi:peptidoglycan/LPS O-acetylase OafA/YrhL